MRALYSLLLPIALFPVAASAQIQQVVLLHNEAGNVVNGTTITADCAWSTDTVSLLTSLTGSVAQTVNVRRHELWPVSGSKNFYCWGVCYLPANSGSYPTWVSQDPVDMTPGVELNNFHAYYQPFGQTGATLFRFVWYNMDTPLGADSAWVDIQFCGQVGIDEQAAAVNGLSVWPLPASGQDVQIDFSLQQPTAHARLALYTILGEQVRTLRIASSGGRVVLPTADLGAGVYFVNLESEGRVLATQRVVVAR